MNNIIKCDYGNNTDVRQLHRFSTIPHSKNTLPGKTANIIIINNSRWWDLKWKSLERTSSSSSSQVTDRTLFISSGRTRTREMYRCTCCCSDCSRPRVALVLWLSLQMTVWQAALPWEQVIKQSHRIYLCFVRRDLEVYVETAQHCGGEGEKVILKSFSRRLRVRQHSNVWYILLRLHCIDVFLTWIWSFSFTHMLLFVC